MSVVGVDFGNLNTVIAVARNRGIDVICNEVSNRATPSMVSYGQKQRFLGESAKTMEISNFRNTVSSLKRLIGRPFDDPEVLSREKSYVNANLVSGEAGEVSAMVQLGEEEAVMNFTQICASYLNKIKSITQNEINGPMTDCVISCPVWFGDRQRRSLVDAAEIVGLNVLRIMNDTTASALGYGITKTDLPDPSIDANVRPRTVVFVDFGNSSLQVAVVQFVKGKLFVRSTSFDAYLGGRDFDDVLATHFAEEFKSKYKIDIASNKKAFYRLRQGCERVKKILSANSISMLNVECIMDDKDVSAKVERTLFEELAQPLLDRILPVLERALKEAGIPKEDIDFVELVGGSTRIPSVKKILSEFFPGKLSTTLNQDEAVARGCALQCAILSPVFIVRDFHLQDYNGYGVTVSWDASRCPASKSGVSAGDDQLSPFPVGSPLPNTKALTFTVSVAGHDSVDFPITAVYDESNIAERGMPQGTTRDIGTFTIEGVKKLRTNEASGNATVKVKARLTPSGVVTFDDAYQLEEETILEDVVAEPEAAPESPATESKEGEAPSAAPTTTAATQGPVKKGKKARKVQTKHPLKIASATCGHSTSVLNKWRELEGNLTAQDVLVIATANARNELEEYIYETRSKVEEGGLWNEFIEASVLPGFLSQLTAAEDWLYSEEGEEAGKSVYNAKLGELKKVSDPVRALYEKSIEPPPAPEPEPEPQPEATDEKEQADNDSKMSDSANEPVEVDKNKENSKSEGSDKATGEAAPAPKARDNMDID